MAGLFLQAFSVSLVLVYVNGDPNTFCDTKPGVPFTFLYFVLQWPGALCAKGCCYSRDRPLPGSHFRPHGLWPAYKDGTSPCFCEVGSSADFKLSTQLQEELVWYWGSISCPLRKSSNFYEYQWRKHGSCTGMRKDQYFQTAMDLYFQYDLASAFQAAGIFPDWRLYKLKDLRKAVVEVSGKLPIITCNFNFEQNARQLSEIFICLDKDMKPFHCPTPKFTVCVGSAILFPAFTPSYNNNPTHYFKPRVPAAGKRRNLYKRGLKLASNHPVVFKPTFKPAKPLTLCMDSTHSTFLYGEQGYTFARMDCPVDNSSLNLKPTRIYVP